MPSLRFGLSAQITASRSDLGKGNARRSTALTKLKIAVFAPTLSASVSTATAVKPGFFSSWRKDNFKPFITQRLHRVDSRRFTARQPAGENRHAHQQQGDCHECQWINRLDLEKQT